MKQLNVSRINFRVILSILGVVIFFILMRRGGYDLPFMRDEGEYAYSAWLLRHDIAPYQNSFLQKPPMIIYTYALAQIINPAAYWMPKIIDYIFVAFATILLGLIVRLEFGSAAGLIAAWIFTSIAMLPGTTQFTANVEHFMILPLMAVLYIYTLKRGKASSFLWFAAGILGGVAVMYKYTILPLLLFIFFSWAVDTWHGSRDLKALSCRIGCAISGTGLAVAASLSYFIAHNALPQLWECTVFFNRYYVGWSEFGGYEGFFRHMKEFFRNWWILFVLTGYFLIKRPPRWRFYLYLLLLSLAVSYGSIYGHYYIVLLPFWAMVCAAALNIFAMEISEKIPARINLIRTALVFMVLVSMHILLPPPFLLASDRLEGERFLRRGYYFESVDVAKRLSDITSDQDYVFVAGSEPQILYYASRRSPTRFVTAYPLMINSPKAIEYQKEAIRALEENPPKAIVLAKHFGSWVCMDSSPKCILGYIMQLLNSGDYILKGGYVQKGGSKYWKETITDAELPTSSLLLFKKKV